MKRFLIIQLLIVASVNLLSAQHVDSRYEELLREVESLQNSRDSLNTLIVDAREQYTKSPSTRKEISSQLSLLEIESIKLKKEYDKALANLTAYEQTQLAQNLENPQLQHSTNKGEQNVVKPKIQRGNLIANDIFAESLSVADYKTLHNAQLHEKKVVECIREYLRHYDKMVSIQLEYERVDTEGEAEVLVQQLDSVRNAANAVDDMLYKSWHAVYDNKIYAYNLLLEKVGKLDVIAAAESSLSNAARLSEQDADTYESYALSDYYFRKSGMLDYELKVATALGLAKAKDSLNRVKKELQPQGYCLPKVNIVRRSFIEYEPLKVIKPIIYNAKNPIPQTKIYEFGTIYRIRLGIFTNRPNLTALRGITPLSYTDAYHNGKYAYFVGGFKTEEEAVEGVQYLRKIGFRDPMIVMWVDGEYISNIEEWKSKRGGYNIEITEVSALSDAVKTHISLRNENCRFSRVGTTFIVGPFVSKADAELVASEIVAMDSSIKAEVKQAK